MDGAFRGSSVRMSLRNSTLPMMCRPTRRVAPTTCGVANEAVSSQQYSAEPGSYTYLEAQWPRDGRGGDFGAVPVVHAFILIHTDDPPLTTLDRRSASPN
eukprot:47094-Eustigmatos_ZCMA.PRE.1